MQWFRVWILLLAIFVAVPARAGEASIIKVLPHYLDLKGRHTLSPSLYERDAYQAFLRKHPEQCSALRFDVQLKAPVNGPLTLRLDIRGKKTAMETIVVQQSIEPTKWFSRWSAAALTGDDFQRCGEVVAWRAQILQRDELLAEQHSFLW